MRVVLILLLLCVLCAGTEAGTPGEGASIQVCFTPGEDCAGLIADTITAAQKSIYVQAYSFTSKPIAQALVKAHQRGVSIVAVLDKSNKLDKGYSAASFLSGSGIQTFIDADHKIAHNKVMIIDDAVVNTGSFNFTKAAQQSNAENVLVVTSRGLAKKYKTNFDTHLSHSEKVHSRY